MESLLEYVENIYDTAIPEQTALVNETATEMITRYSFQDIIDDETACIKLIDAIIENDQSFVSFNKQRASHILITWLLGIGLSKVFHLDSFDKSDAFLNNYFYRLWSLTAMIHDYGYFLKETQKVGLTLDEITKKFDLLTDVYYHNYKDDQDLYYLDCLNDLTKIGTYSRFFSYSYSEIKNYFRLSQAYHASHPSDYGEISDHGIVGGCVAFSKYCLKCKRDIEKGIGIKPSNTITIQQKIACFVSASHNVYKSQSNDSDKKYVNAGLPQLQSTSPKRVKKRNVLLLLLSLVDTIECTKRFSKKNNASSFLIQKTTLNYVDIGEQNNSIVLDFSRLANYISSEKKRSDLKVSLDSHIKGIVDLSTWTPFNVIQNSTYRLTIYLH